MNQPNMQIFDTEDPNFYEDPYPAYKWLRDEYPVYHDKKNDLWFVSRYADIASCLGDFSTFSSKRGNAIRDVPARVGKSLGSMDPPRHDELRRIIQKGLGNDRVNGLLPIVRKLTAEKVAEFRDQKQCDVMQDFGKPILYNILGRILGLDEERSLEGVRLSNHLFHQNEDPAGPVLLPEHFKEIYDFFVKEMEDRSRNSKDDMITALLEAKASGQALSEDEIATNLVTVLLAGNASIAHYFSNFIYAMWEFPDQLKILQEDPSKIPHAIEEGVRWDTSTQSFARQTTRDVTLGDTTIPEDSRVVLIYASANRDERAIENPDVFDMNRKRVRHYGFGAGPHICAGSYASRVILSAMIEEMLPLLRDFSLDIPASKRVRHLQVRGFSNLKMAWS